MAEFAEPDVLSDFAEFKKSFKTPELNPELAARLEQAKTAYKEKYGKDLPITSQVRTRKEQQDLYNRYKRGEKGIYIPTNPADYPNQEYFHTDAADISTEVPDDFLKQFGLHRPSGKKDPVHTVIDPSYKPVLTEPKVYTEPDVLSEFQQDKSSLFNAPQEQEYKPGFYNPNLVAQGERSRAISGSGLEPIVSDISNVLGQMSWEDWKKNALTANMLKYGVGGMPIIGDEQMKEEARQKLIEAGKGMYQTITHPIETLTALSEQRPGQVLGEMIKGGVYEAPLAVAGEPIVAGVKPVLKATGKALQPIAETVAETVAPAQEAFQRLKNKPTVTIEGANYQPEIMTGGGAANVTKQNQINALVPDLSSETQNVIRNVSPEKINLPALETKALEEKHGIDLSQGQRTGSARYADEWNRRTTDERLQNLFSKQPSQFQIAFDKLLDKHASDIGELTKENIGQTQINALAAKDKIRLDNIKQAYQDLETANGGQLPIDISQLNNNINSALAKKLKTNVYEDKLSTIKKDIDGLIKNGQMTFEDYENLRSNLSDEMRTNQSGSAKAAAYIIREQLENLPIFGAEGGSPQAMQLKALADKARSLYSERQNIIKTNPAYKAAIKEATDIAEAESIESLNAAKFHDKFVTNGTPEVTRRMIEEIKDNPNALKAIRAGDIINARDALVPNTQTPQLRPDMYNKYLRSQSSKTKYVHDAESAQDLLDLGILSGKVAQPKDKAFNYSNSYSAYLGDLLKEGLSLKGQMALAKATGGASIPVVGAGKEIMERLNKSKFVNETLNPHAGIVQEK